MKTIKEINEIKAAARTELRQINNDAEIFRLEGDYLSQTFYQNLEHLLDFRQ